MKSAVETLSPTRAKLTVEANADDMKPSLDAAYQEVAKQVNIPGFRKGKVPPAVLDRQVGREAILGQAINDALPKFYMQALQDNELVPLDQPEVEIIKQGEDDSLEFTAEVDVRPEIAIPDYQGIEVEVEDAEVGDDDVDTQLEALQGRFAAFKEVERPAVKDDDLLIDMVASKDGDPIEGGEVSNQQYVVSSEVGLDGLDEAVIGLSAGEEETFDSTLAGGDMAGEAVSVKVKVNAVRERELPELDDDFAQMASEFDTIAELRDDLQTRLMQGARLEQAASARDAVLEKLLESAEIPLPDALVTNELNARRQEMDQQLAMAGMTMEQYLESEGETIDDFEGDMERRVREAIAAQFLLDQVVKEEEIQPDQQELSNHLMSRAQQSGQNPQEFIQMMIQNNQLPELAVEVARGKALAQIVESAKVTDASGNAVDIANLRPDGTIGDPEAEAAEATEAEAEASEDADEG